MKPDSSHGGDAPVTQSPQHNAAADIIRQQINSLYDSPGENAAPAQAAQPAPQQTSLHRTHQAHPLPEAEQWKQYHSAWQNYYQQYYEQYYTQQAAHPGQYFSSSQQDELPVVSDSLTKDAALVELRQELLGKVQSSAKKIRKSRHFVPIFASLVVVLVFVFVQYNRSFVAAVNAYVSPGAMSPQNIVIDPAADTVVTQDPRLIIPKINVDVPVVYGVGYDEPSQMKAMEKGVAHFAIPGANSHPGEVGNTVLSGHSSNDLFDSGDYKFIFAQLERLAVGDTLYANYKGVRYTYVVTKTEVVRPTEVSKLVYTTDKPILTLITCTPLGTALNRLLVTAEQVNPDPGKAAKAPEGSGSTDNQSNAIPGNSPSFLERLFGRR